MEPGRPFFQENEARVLTTPPPAYERQSIRTDGTHNYFFDYSHHYESTLYAQMTYVRTNKHRCTYTRQNYRCNSTNISAFAISNSCFLWTAFKCSELRVKVDLYDLCDSWKILMVTVLTCNFLYMYHLKAKWEGLFVHLFHSKNYPMDFDYI
jgi:hypothetical protein